MPASPRSTRDGLALGLRAAGPALLVLVGAHALGGSPGFLEAIQDGFGHLPIDLVGAAISTFGSAAKGLLYVGIGLGVLAFGALAGLVAEAWLGEEGPIADTLALAAGLFLVAEVPVLWLFGAGVFGSGLAFDAAPLHAPLALACFAFGAVFAGLRAARAAERGAPEAAPASLQPGVAGARSPEAAADPSRRRFLAGALAFVGSASAVASLGAMGAQAFAAARVPGSAPPPPATSGGAAGGGAAADGFGPTPALTPVADFYQVAKDLIAPDVAEGSWRFTIDGLVERPQAFSLADLRALPAVEGYRTLECISTEIVHGDHLIGNQRWTGVRLSELLDRARAAATASWVLWQAADGYTESLPLAVARHPDSWLVHAMDGAPLSRDHGFPARILIAGRFGMKQPKWVTRMTLADHDEAGYWEERGWDEQALVRTMSRIDAPADGLAVAARAGVPFGVYGIAYAGDRGISRVEVSPDGGRTWVAATLRPVDQAPLGPLSWIPWRATLTIAQRGSARLVVRATDGTGATQDGTETPAPPSGSTGWHAVRVVVSD